MTEWPNITVFGIYDGHGGVQCADYLKQNLHERIIGQPTFPVDVFNSIKLGAKQIDEEFLLKMEKEFRERYSESKNIQQSVNKAGSCAIMVIVINDEVFIVNVGDSRAVASKNDGKEILAITSDHKPIDPREFERIIKNGGKIY